MRKLHVGNGICDKTLIRMQELPIIPTRQIHATEAQPYHNDGSKHECYSQSTPVGRTRTRLLHCSTTSPRSCVEVVNQERSSPGACLLYPGIIARWRQIGCWYYGIGPRVAERKTGTSPTLCRAE